ncbi:MAG: NAD(P)(+) transhydrogenase (Re/Si-specific) subunit beta [Rickettsiaceae bacterium]|nr:MAG: NAD(P)(+) transhydrogenase (Re/Si-specific) subunit beta [Rickettsiaceae bacterium]
MSHQFIQIAYLVSAICFIVALKGLSSPKQARIGSLVGIIGMVVSLVATFYQPLLTQKLLLIIVILSGGAVGAIIAKKIKMTAMPQLVAGFHSFVGLAAVLVAYSVILEPENFNLGHANHLPAKILIEVALGAAIGALTFSGSIIAFGKLQGLIGARSIKFIGQQYLCIALSILVVALIILFVTSNNIILFSIMVLLSFLLGIMVIVPVGGADMPVIVSMLNSYSGWAAAGIGFTLCNNLLIITGALVGASGAILSYVMCKAMNRSLIKVVFGAFLDKPKSLQDATDNNKITKVSNPEDAAYIIKNAQSVIIVPGYGMAVAQSQHAVRELVDILEKNETSVRFAIHPVAGRMPGHMNVLLAEANIDYEKVLELEEINRDFAHTDVVIVLGANDITNPSAKNDPDSPIYGMPILEVAKARTVLFVKRSMAAGYAGIENQLFYEENTLMLFGDAKKVVEELIKNFNDN